MATERKVPRAGEALIPDLDVRAKAPSKAVSIPRPSPAPRPSERRAPDVHDYFGSGTFDAEHFGDAGPSALETSEAGGAMPAFEDEIRSEDGHVIELADAAEPGSASTRGARSGAPGWPTGRSPDSASLDIDTVEVRLAADYGPSPANAALAPLYAARVFRRRAELAARVKELGAEFTHAEKNRDDLLVSAILGLRGKILLTEGGEDLLAPVIEIEKLALDRRSALAGTNEEYDRRAREIDDGAQVLRAEAARNAVDVEAAESTLAKQRELFERASAKKKRQYIEIRAILDTAEKAGGNLSAQQSARVAELEASVAAHNPEVQRTEEAVRDASAALAAAEASGKQTARRIAEAGRLRRALDDEFKKQIGARSEGVTESERERDEALSEVMRKVLAARGRIVDVPRDVMSGIATADRSVHARALELEKFVRALDTYDADAYRRGIIVGAILIALLIGVISALAL